MLYKTFQSNRKPVILLGFLPHVKDKIPALSGNIGKYNKTRNIIVLHRTSTMSMQSASVSAEDYPGNPLLPLPR